LTKHSGLTFLPLLVAAASVGGFRRATGLGVGVGARPTEADGLASEGAPAGSAAANRRADAPTPGRRPAPHGPDKIRRAGPGESDSAPRLPGSAVRPALTGGAAPTTGPHSSPVGQDARGPSPAGVGGGSPRSTVRAAGRRALANAAIAAGVA